MKKIAIHNLGLKPYREVWELQKKLQQELIQSTKNSSESTDSTWIHNTDITDHLIFCEHPPVITHGKSAKTAHLLSKKEHLEDSSIEVLEIERGGDFTYHGPGQFVAYPIINLKRHRRDVGWYLRKLEQSVIEALSAFQVEAQCINGKTGVWVTDEDGHRKICSIGVRLSRWCSMHGLAVNIRSESERGFSHIIPCGIAGVEMTSLESERLKNGITDSVCMNDFLGSFQEIFLAQFSYQ